MDYYQYFIWADFKEYEIRLYWSKTAISVGEAEAATATWAIIVETKQTFTVLFSIDKLIGCLTDNQ